MKIENDMVFDIDLAGEISSNLIDWITTEYGGGKGVPRDKIDSIVCAVIMTGLSLAQYTEREDIHLMTMVSRCSERLFETGAIKLDIESMVRGNLH